MEIPMLPFENADSLLSSFLIVFLILFVVFSILVFLLPKVEKRGRDGREGWEPSEIVKAKFIKKYPGITVGEYDVVVMALKDFFNLIYDLRIKGKKRSVSMTSVIVDDLWHELILDTKNYMKICEYYGGYIHHTPESVQFEVDFSEKAVGNALLETYELAKAESKGNKDDLPLLFAVDSLMGLKGGYIFNRAILESQLEMSKKSSH